jgi:uncharacterized protein YndB with AHSA1/START domain
MIDIVREIEAIGREVGTKAIPAGDGQSVTLTRDFDAPIDDVWDALTTPERITRWFLPIEADLRIGGRYQLTGQAGGEILECQRPSRFKITWAYGENITPEQISEVEVQLAPLGEDRTRLRMEHAAVTPPEMWDQFGPGAVGVGWDQGLLGLSLYLRTGATVDDPVAWQLSDEGIDYATRSSNAWGAANVAAGADPDVVERNIAATTAFYTTVPEAPPEAEPDAAPVA